MGIHLLTLIFSHMEIRKLIITVSSVVFVIVVLQEFVLPHKNMLSVVFSVEESSTTMVVHNISGLNNLGTKESYGKKSPRNGDGDCHLESDVDINTFKGFGCEKGVIDNNTLTMKNAKHGEDVDVGNMNGEFQYDLQMYGESPVNITGEDVEVGNKNGEFQYDLQMYGESPVNITGDEVVESNRFEMDKIQNLSTSTKGEAIADSRTLTSVFTPNISSWPEDTIKQERKTEPQDEKTDLVQNVSVLNDAVAALERNLSALRRSNRHPVSISQMNLRLSRSFVSSGSKRPGRLSPRDRNLLQAKLEIINAPIIRNNQELSASVFRNISMFKRSYELMERTLKVYVYKEGEKPIFHQPKMRGIYASEGWFMKLMEGNKIFTVKDPKKAHLFYLPFSSVLLRAQLAKRDFDNKKDLEYRLKNYVDFIGRKYSFWNRTGGSDHFLVACHDWAPYLTRRYMKDCIRSLCNSNIGSGFKFGKDSTLPVTYIRSAELPLENIGGKLPSERPTLAFFAGELHGYVRPIILQYWQNKEPDMKIFGPMPRDIEGKEMYRQYMKSSKYCICARGYEVHTPRVVEAIFYECVPVIIADNYVPPFFEVLNWESFSVFVEEKEIPNLRNILLSIPYEKYREMQSRVKMVQKHFLWHKRPVKYDLFHMVLHSVWYSRVFQVKTK